MALITVQDDILFLAFRYALGRMTFVPSEVARVIRLHMHRLETRNLTLMSKEIQEARDWRRNHPGATTDRLGMSSDRELWLDLLIEIQEELAKREKKNGRVNTTT